MDPPQSQLDTKVSCAPAATTTKSHTTTTNMNPTPFRQIGKGYCGSVWAVDRPGPASAIKRADGGPGRDLARDSAMHLIIQHSLETTQSSLGLAERVNIPQHRQFISADESKWWEQRAYRFPPMYEHCDTLITERILPLQREAREKIIDLFCLEQSRSIIKNSRKDEDCLIRPYLGRRRDHFSCPSPYFTLRNKPLLVNQLDAISLPTRDYAEAMADTLAILYWHAKTDANDVEFVLAPARPDEENFFASGTLGSHRIWILDFDCVNAITLDEKGVERAAVAFFGNDPFYPRPDGEHQRDKSLWNIFKVRFLQSSAALIPGSELPQMFVGWLEKPGAREKAGALRYSVKTSLH